MTRDDASLTLYCTTYPSPGQAAPGRKLHNPWIAKASPTAACITKNEQPPKREPTVEFEKRVLHAESRKSSTKSPANENRTDDQGVSSRRLAIT